MTARQSGEAIVRNIINHHIYVLDASGSMMPVARYLVSVMDDLIAFLAAQSRDKDQETRVTVYVFNYRQAIRCVITDKDVYRMPSIRGLYRAGGTTALIDAMLLAIEDAQLIPQKYGDHSFMLTALTDGRNNDSLGTPAQLSTVITELPDNWTVACFVPNDECGELAIQCGIPEGNVATWDATTEEGIEAGGQLIQRVTTTYMDNRAKGIRGSKRIFRAAELTSADVRTMTLVTKGSYEVYEVGTADRRADEFAREKTGRFDNGHWYYQFTKSEMIQGSKIVLIMDKDGNLYSGPEVRRKLGLPVNADQRFNPAKHGDVTVFVQSTAMNRSFRAGTRVVMCR
jgi:hypothetical protein